MARTEITAQARPASNPASATTITFTDMSDDGDGYKVKSNGTLAFIVWNNGATGEATFTVSSVAVQAWQDRTGDVIATLATGAHAVLLVPSLGFNNAGWVYFECGGTGADDIDVAILKNM
jgi:hypothetical protein